MLLCYSEEALKERFQLVNVRARGFYFAVTKRIFNETAGCFFEVFGLDDINELHILKNHCFHNEYHLDKGTVTRVDPA